MEAEPTKAEPPKRKRRWFQFRLRTLLIGVTLLCVAGGGYLGRQKSIVWERNTALQMLRSSGCEIVWMPQPDPNGYRPETTWIRRELGDREIYKISSPRGRGFANSELEIIHRVFPELSSSFLTSNSEFSSGQQEHAVVSH